MLSELRDIGVEAASRVRGLRQDYEGLFPLPTLYFHERLYLWCYFQLVLVHDTNGKPRGYAFVEYSHKSEMSGMSMDCIPLTTCATNHLAINTSLLHDAKAGISFAFSSQCRVSTCVFNL